METDEKRRREGRKRRRRTVEDNHLEGRRTVGQNASKTRFLLQAQRRPRPQEPSDHRPGCHGHHEEAQPHLKNVRELQTASDRTCMRVCVWVGEVYSIVVWKDG